MEQNFWKGKDAQSCAICAKFLKKSDKFLLPSAFIVHAKTWVNFYINMDFEVVFNAKNALYVFNDIISSIFKVNYHSKIHTYVKIYPDFLHAL